MPDVEQVNVGEIVEKCNNNNGLVPQSEIVEVEPESQIQEATNRSIFFASFLETGRDFDSLANVYNARMRKSNVNAAKKSKEQIQQNYYKLWYKLQPVVKEINFPDRQVLEILAMVNYAALYKAKLDEQFPNLITSLIKTGSVTGKVKGKLVKVKTPSCKALKLLANVLCNCGRKIPENIEISLMPANHLSWTAFQTCAQNPRMVFHVNSKKSLSEIFLKFNSMIAESTKVNCMTDLTFFPAPNKHCHDVADEISVPSRPEYNLEFFEIISDKAKYESKTSSRLNNVHWNFARAKNLSLRKLYRMFSYPKRIELLYSFSYQSDNSTNGLTTNMPSISSELKRCLAYKFSEIAKIRLDEIEKKRRNSLMSGAADMNLNQIKPMLPMKNAFKSKRFMKQLMPLKSQFVKKMLIDGQTMEVNRFSSAEENNNDANLHSITIENQTPDLNITNDQNINQMIEQIHQPNENSQYSFASLFGNAENVNAAFMPDQENLNPVPLHESSTHSFSSLLNNIGLKKSQKQNLYPNQHVDTLAENDINFNTFINNQNIQLMGFNQNERHDLGFNQNYLEDQNGMLNLSLLAGIDTNNVIPDECEEDTP